MDLRETLILYMNNKAITKEMHIDIHSSNFHLTLFPSLGATGESHPESSKIV